MNAGCPSLTRWFFSVDLVIDRFLQAPMTESFHRAKLAEAQKGRTKRSIPVHLGNLYL